MNTEAMIAALAAEAKPTPPAPRPLRQAGLWLAGSAVYIAILVATSGPRPDLMAALRRPAFAAELGLLGALMAASLFSAALLALPDLFQKARWAWLPAPVFALFAALLAHGWMAAAPAPVPPGMECLLCITGYAVLPSWLLFITIRRRATTHAAAAGAAALLAGFSIGAFALRLIEETDVMPHLVIWHYLPMIGASLIGIVLGKVFLRW